jgi:hypothetical protein
MRGAGEGGNCAAVGVHMMVVSSRVGWVWMVNLPVGSMSRSRLMGS